MMAGDSKNHTLLSAAIGSMLKAALLGRNCPVLGSDLYVRIEPVDLSTYPDAMVICGKTSFAKDSERVVDNPVLVVEVLSPSTQTYDQGEKFAAYQQLDSLREVLFISQDRPTVEYWQKSPSGWISTTAEGLASTLILSQLQISIPLAELYRRVTWDEA